MKKTILLKMNGGYGLGDNVSFSIVLQHLRKYRPHWQIDYVTDPGREKAAIGLANRVFTYGQQINENAYDKAITVYLFECKGLWADRPNTPAVACVHEKFGLNYDATLGRYCVQIGQDARNLVSAWLASLKVPRSRYGQFRAVCVHPYGKSNPLRKNLTVEQIADICDFIRWTDRLPIILDCGMDERTIADMQAVSPHPKLLGGDAEHVAAIANACEAFVGVDSGPAKCASSTDTPSLVVWTKHHPLYYHDPSPNTTHLLPTNHREIMPGEGKSDKMAAYFDSAYRSIVYGSLVSSVQEWLLNELDPD